MHGEKVEGWQPITAPGSAREAFLMKIRWFLLDNWRNSHLGLGYNDYRRAINSFVQYFRPAIENDGQAIALANNFCQFNICNSFSIFFACLLDSLEETNKTNPDPYIRKLVKKIKSSKLYQAT